MIDINLKYHTALFGPMDDISPKPEVLKYFINAFADKNFIPTTIQELSPAGVKNLLALKTSDNVWSIEFGSKRIDISKTDQDIGNSDFGSKQDFIEEVKDVINIIFEKYPKKLNRISFVTHYLLKEMSEQEMNDIFNHLIIPVGLHKEQNPYEWNSRIVSRINEEINQKEELLNVITEVNRIRGKLKIESKQKQIDRVQLKFDINTFQGNSEYRFSNEEIESFYAVSNKIEDSLVNSYINLLSD